MAAAAARVSGELVRERERGSGEARGMGCGGARLYSLGVRRASEGDRGDRGIPDPSGSGRSPARSWRGRGVGEDGAGPTGQREGERGEGVGWSWAGLARLACWPSGPAGLGQAGRGGVRRWLGLGWPGWRPGGFFFIFLNKTKTKNKTLSINILYRVYIYQNDQGNIPFHLNIFPKAKSKLYKNPFFSNSNKIQI